MSSAEVPSIKIAYAAGYSAGNKSMRKAARTAWSQDDFEAAVGAMHDVLAVLDEDCSGVEGAIERGLNCALRAARRGRDPSGLFETPDHEDAQ